MKRCGELVVAAVAVALLLAGTAASAAISAAVDRYQVALGDTLRLTITATDGEDIDELDLGPLQRDFEILQRSSSTQTSIVNGRFSSSRELLLDLTPLRQGTLTVPSLAVDGQRTAPLEVTVGPPPTGPDGNQVVLFEAEVDRSSVYVQGQVILTLRVQESINLDDRSVTELKLDNAFVHTLEQQSFQRNINGRPWLIHEIRYAIFPERSGTLTIPAQTYSARERLPRRSLFDLGTGGRQLRRATEPLQVEVMPRPDGYPQDASWLPAEELTVQESWSTDPEQLRVGESVTRSVTIRGVGLQGAQLPPVLHPATAGLKFYPDQPDIQDSEAASGLVGTRVDSVAIVPTSAGNWEIPELRIPWWDTGSNQLRYAVLPGRTLDVLPAAASAGADPVAAQSAPASGTAGSASPAIHIESATRDQMRLWQLLAGVNGLLWLLTLAYLWWYRRRAVAGRAGKPERPAADGAGESRAFKAALAACGGSDASGARQAVISWAAALAPQRRPVSLTQVAALFDDEALASALASLDTALYRDGGQNWEGAALAQCLRDARDRHRKGAAPTPGEAFTLYPQGA